MAMTIIRGHAVALPDRPKAPVIDIRRLRPAGPPDRLGMIDTLESTIRRLLRGRNLVDRRCAHGDSDRRLTLRIDWHTHSRYWDVRVIVGCHESARTDTLRAYVTAGLTPWDVDYGNCDSGTCRMDAEMFASSEHVDESARMWARQAMDDLFPVGVRPDEGEDSREDSIYSDEY